MVQLPLQERYAPVEKVPQELQALSKTMRPGNTRELLGLLMKRPAGRLIGRYWQNEGKVLLDKPLLWLSVGGERTLREVVRYHEVKLAISALRSLLKHHRLPYGVWKSSRPKAHGQAAPLKIGLVDTRKPLGPAARIRAG